VREEKDTDDRPARGRKGGERKRGGGKNLAADVIIADYTRKKRSEKTAPCHRPGAEEGGKKEEKYRPSSLTAT